ncbi:hypothetical protein R3I93_004740 [Phoxinus phoxinus]|uniref:Uncharacterized protein n=1 Tax=Phoxinus phoxinus TaxID=58324 RepID=A0AAN9HEM9_9TELE
MDHNMNVGRQLKKTQEGDPQFKYTYTKASHQWVAKPIYEKTSQAFRKDLMEAVLRMRQEHTLEHRPRPRSGQRRLLMNIAPVSRPDKSEMQSQRLSRFKHS